MSNQANKTNRPLANQKIKENSHARCLKAIPNESKNEFVIGLNNQTSSFLTIAEYEESNNKIKIYDLTDFESEAENKRKISNVVDVYIANNNLILTQLCNEESKTKTLGAVNFERLENGGINTDKEKVKTSFLNFEDENVFDLQLDENNANKCFLITKDNFNVFDLAENKTVETLNFNKLLASYNTQGNSALNKTALTEFTDSNPIKICSDVSKIDPNQIAIGVNENILFLDTREKAFSSLIPSAHFNGILSCEFNPLKTNILTTSGLDYAIKFWDIRNLSSPVSGVFDNSHWVWRLKYNKTYSRILMGCSSSSLVRGYVFESEAVEDYSHSLGGFDLKKFEHLDYLEFEDSVYDFDWAHNDPWIFSAVSYNGYLHINVIPDEVKYKIMIY